MLSCVQLLHNNITYYRIPWFSKNNNNNKVSEIDALEKFN